MRIRFKFLTALFAAPLLWGAAPADAQGFALGVVGGTQGAGVQLTLGLVPRANLRLGAQGLDLSRDHTERDITYRADAELRNAYLLFDLHPGAGDFRLSAGVAVNRNRVVGRSPVSGTVIVNDVAYNVSSVGTLEAELTTRRVAPYVGLGWGNAVAPGSPLRFVFDLGATYHQEPRLSLVATPTNPALVPPDFYANLEAERVKAEDDLSRYRFYPVVNLGLSYRF